jgi:protein PhnA
VHRDLARPRVKDEVHVLHRDRAERHLVAEATEAVRMMRDAVGKVPQDGDTVTVIKDLKVKGSSTVVKVGTKVKNIRRIDGDHDIDCRIDGVGAMGLKSEFVRKA